MPTEEEIIDAITNLFGDTRVSVLTTRERLENIISHAETLLESLPEDE